MVKKAIHRMLQEFLVRLDKRQDHARAYCWMFKQDHLAKLKNKIYLQDLASTDKTNCLILLKHLTFKILPLIISYQELLQDSVYG